MSKGKFYPEMFFLLFFFSTIGLFFLAFSALLNFYIDDYVNSQRNLADILSPLSEYSQRETEF